MVKLMEIEFNHENIEKCLCSGCKVQGKSECVKERLIMLQERALGSELIKPEDFPALYCAGGKEQCPDLDEHENCLCPDCIIYIENDFETGDPNSYFCLNGGSNRCSYCEIEEQDYSRINDLIRDMYTRVD
jgi:hypothetical protein